MSKNASEPRLNGPAHREEDVTDVPAEPLLELRRLKDLLPHPKQAEFFEDLPLPTIAELATDIRKNGLRIPIDVLPANTAGLPPNTVIAGHQRLRALLHDAHREHTVRVRYDLANATPEEIEDVFLADNVPRRHSTPLARARILLRRHQLSGRHSAESSICGLVREKIANELGMTGRNLKRYVLVLQTPAEVQGAFESRKLTLVAASKVALLDQAVQETIAREIRNGGDAKHIVATALQGCTRVSVDPHTSLRRLVGALKKHESLATRVQQITRHGHVLDLPALRGGHRLLGILIAHLEKMLATRGPYVDIVSRVEEAALAASAAKRVRDISVIEEDND
jgi:hypothetical protein